MGRRKTSTEERERAQFILDRANSMYEAKQYYSQNWEEYERRFKMFEDSRDGEDSWRAVLPDTWAFATIKTAQSAFSDSTIAPSFSHEENEDQMKSRDLFEVYDFNAKKGALDTELYFVRLDAMKLGTGFLKTSYIRNERKVFEVDTFNPDTEDVVYKENTIREFDDVKTERVSPYLMLVDDMARAGISTARDCIEVEILDNTEAKRKYGHLIDDWDTRVVGAPDANKFIDINKTSIATTADENTGRKSEESIDEFRFFAPTEFNENTVQILHYWSKNMGTKGTDTYEIIANETPLQVDTNRKPSPIPYIHKQLPFSDIVFSHYSGDEFWGAGIIEIGISETTAIKKHREKMDDRQTLALFSPVFANPNDEIDQKQLKLKPLSVIRTRGGVPSQYQIPGISNGDLALQTNLEDSYKRAVGVDERVLGVSSDVRLTATEVSMLREAAMRRLREFANTLKRAMEREIRVLKLPSFKQYYASPVSREHMITGDDGIKQIAQKARQIKVKIDDNTFRMKDVTDNLFAGDIDVDIDMQLLIPATKSQQQLQWSTIIAQSAPFIQTGVIDLSIDKMFERWFDSMDVNMDSLRGDEQSEAIMMAESEHRMFTNSNTAKATAETLEDGTPRRFLTAQHIKRHKELLDSAPDIDGQARGFLEEHIQKDLDNFKEVIQEQAQQQAQVQQQLPQEVTQPLARPPQRQPQPELQATNQPLQ